MGDRQCLGIRRAARSLTARLDAMKLRRITVATALCASSARIAHPPPPTPRALLLEARAQLSNVGDRSEHWADTRGIATWLAWAGFYDDAIETTRMDSMFTPFAYTDLARARAANGDIDGAIVMVDTTLSGDAAAKAKVEIASDLADSGNFVAAGRVAQRLPARSQGEVQLAIAGRQTDAGDLTQAEKTIDAAAVAGANVDDARARLAEAYARRGDRAQADRLARSSKDAENAPDLDDARLARAFQMRAWDSAKVLIKATGGPATYGAPGAFVVLAREMAKAHDTAAARRTLDEATSMAVRLKGEVARLSVLSAIAVAQYDMGLRPAAAARMVMPDLSKHPNRLGAAACDVTWGFAAARRYSDALTLERTTHCGIWLLAGYQFRAGDIEGALRTIRLETNRSLVLTEIGNWASFAAKHGDVTTARRMFDMLEVREPRDDGYVTPAATEVAHAIAASGDVEGSASWARARVTAAQRVAALVGAARAMVEKQNPRAHALEIR